MTQEHPITPPPELVQEWIKDADHNKPMFAQVAVTAARWGADQELEACRLWVSEESIYAARELVEARRPKPLSLKEQALDQLRSIEIDLTRCGMGIGVETIRRALESLPD